MIDTIRIAIMGNCTTEYTGRAVESECGKHGISASVYYVPYNQYVQETLNRESGYYRFKPDLTFIMLEGRYLFPEWYETGTLLQDAEKKYACVRGAFDAVRGLAESIRANINTLMVLNNFVLPYHSPLGILDCKFYPGIKDMISLLNNEIDKWAGPLDYAYIFDYCGLVAQFGAQNTEDPKMYYLAKVPLSLRYTGNLAAEYMRYILPMKYRNKKCLVLDLDNTLWGGIVGEDGVAGIKLDISGPGRCYYDFQKEILNLYQRGIILAVNSRNNPEDAIEAIENHPHMLLKKSHFSCLKINWQDKVKNLQEISAELNIGLDSIVFFDDNPVERDYVKSLLPMVTVVDVPSDSSKYVRALRNEVAFETLRLTDEDMKRNSMYAENLKRIEYRSKFASHEEYLSSLEMRLFLKHADEFTIPRMAQLTQKTNQFNMTTKRYTQDDMEAMFKSGRYLILSCSVTDKFNDNGIVGVCIAEPVGNNAVIDTFLLSCRVMGRNVEYAFISKVVSLLRKKGVSSIRARYVESEKNRANRDFYASAGFTPESTSGNELWFILNGNEQTKKIDYIDVIYEEEGRQWMKNS